MLHSSAYLATALTLIGLACLGFAIPPAVSVAMAGICVALLGVPHGGLDHWVGRRLLHAHVGNWWPVIFLPLYLLIGVAFVACWCAAPVHTIVFFFLVSAWHFGREDNLGHIESLAVGGLAIWLPALTRSDEMKTILDALILSPSPNAADQIVYVAGVIGFAAIPIATWSICFGTARPFWSVALATAVASIVLPILCSFVLFFCGWHSIRGLTHLRTDENLTWRRFAWAVLPLSIGAVTIVVLAGVFFGEYVAEPTSNLRLLFIGLASIAIPHLFLHEIKNMIGIQRTSAQSHEVLHAR